MTDVYAEIGETSKGPRIILHGPPVVNAAGETVMTETMWNDKHPIMQIPGKNSDRGIKGGRSPFRGRRALSPDPRLVTGCMSAPNWPLGRVRSVTSVSVRCSCVS